MKTKGLRLIHSLLGLVTAGFLILTGLTGAIISWDHELDELINPQLMLAPTSSAMTSEKALFLANQLEKRYPDVEISYLPLAVEQGHSLAVFVSPKWMQATQQLSDVPFNQIFINHETEQELGKREWGAVFPITQENFVSFLYKLHYSLHFPEMNGIDRWGMWLLGIIGFLWLVNNFIGLTLTFPRLTGFSMLKQAQWWRIWRKGFILSVTVDRLKTAFQLHRLLGLWLWGLLIIIAFTAFSLNLYREVFIPVMSATTDLTPSIYAQRPFLSPSEFKKEIQSRESILNKAITQAQKLSWHKPISAISYMQEFALYRVDFFELTDDHGVGGAGHDSLFLMLKQAII